MVLIVNINICCQFCARWYWIYFSLFYCNINLILCSIINFFQLLFISNLVFEDDIFNVIDAISCLSLLLNLLSCSVCNTWITHRMTMISICHGFNENWTFLQTVFFGEFQCLSDLEDIVSINLNSWNNITSSVELSIGTSSVN